MSVQQLTKPLFVSLLSLSIVFTPTLSFAKPAPSLASGQTTNVPAAFGEVTETYQGTNGKTIYFIQDAHDSLDAQESIARLITHLVENENVKTVYEEGFEGAVPTDAYFKTIENERLRQAVAFYFMDQLRLSGSEYAHINRKKDFKLIGADDLKLRRENVEWYRRAAVVQELVSDDLGKIESALKVIINRDFPKSFKNWIKINDRFRAGDVELSEYIKYLYSMSHGKELIVEYQYLHGIIEAGQVSATEIPEKLRSMQAYDLFTEIERFETQLLERLIRSEEESIIFSFYQTVQILERLNRLEMTNAQYLELKKSLANFDTAAVVALVSRKSKGWHVLSRKWEELIYAALQFYETALARDVAAAKTLRTFSESSSEKSAALVFGGFHGNVLKQAMKDQGFSFSVIMPKISSVDETYRSLYRSSMSLGTQTAGVGAASGFVPLERVVELVDAAERVIDAQNRIVPFLSLPELDDRAISRQVGPLNFDAGRGVSVVNIEPETELSRAEVRISKRSFLKALGLGAALSPDFLAAQDQPADSGAEVAKKIEEASKKYKTSVDGVLAFSTPREFIQGMSELYGVEASRLLASIGNPAIFGADILDKNFLFLVTNPDGAVKLDDLDRSKGFPGTATSSVRYPARYYVNKDQKIKPLTKALLPERSSRDEPEGVLILSPVKKFDEENKASFLVTHFLSSLYLLQSPEKLKSSQGITREDPKLLTDEVWQTGRALSVLWFRILNPKADLTDLINFHLSTPEVDARDRGGRAHGVREGMHLLTTQGKNPLLLDRITGKDAALVVDGVLAFLLKKDFKEFVVDEETVKVWLSSSYPHFLLFSYDLTVWQYIDPLMKEVEKEGGFKGIGSFVDALALIQNGVSPILAAQYAKKPTGFPDVLEDEAKKVVDPSHIVNRPNFKARFLNQLQLGTVKAVGLMKPELQETFYEALSVLFAPKLGNGELTQLIAKRQAAGTTLTSEAEKSEQVRLDGYLLKLARAGAALKSKLREEGAKAPNKRNYKAVYDGFSRDIRNVSFDLNGDELLKKSQEARDLKAVVDFIVGNPAVIALTLYSANAKLDEEPEGTSSAAVRAEVRSSNNSASTLNSTRRIVVDAELLERELQLRADMIARDVTPEAANETSQFATEILSLLYSRDYVEVVILSGAPVVGEHVNALRRSFKGRVQVRSANQVPRKDLTVYFVEDVSQADDFMILNRKHTFVSLYKPGAFLQVAELDEADLEFLAQQGEGFIVSIAPMFQSKVDTFLSEAGRFLIFGFSA